MKPLFCREWGDGVGEKPRVSLMENDSLSLSLSYNLGISSFIPLSAHYALVRSDSLCPFVEDNSLPSSMVVCSEIKSHIQNLL